MRLAWGLIVVGVGPWKKLNGAVWIPCGSPVVKWGVHGLSYQLVWVWGEEVG